MQSSVWHKTTMLFLLWRTQKAALYQDRTLTYQVPQSCCFTSSSSDTKGTLSQPEEKCQTWNFICWVFIQPTIKFFSQLMKLKYVLVFQTKCQIYNLCIFSNCYSVYRCILLRWKILFRKMFLPKYFSLFFQPLANSELLVVSCISKCLLNLQTFIPNASVLIKNTMKLSFCPNEWYPEF